MGHSRCGGVKRLMSLPDHTHTYDCIDEWLKISLAAKKKVLEEANHMPFEEQSKLCEKESMNNWMANLLTYPFVRSGVVSGALKLRGGYHDFVNGNFEQWKMQGKPMPPTIPKPMPKTSKSNHWSVSH